MGIKNKTYSLDELTRIIYPIASKHNVKKIYLFGSYARGAANSTSDIDLCIDAPAIRGMFALGRLYADLSDALQKNLDLVTVNALKYSTDVEFVENLEKDVILVYEQK